MTKPGPPTAVQLTETHDLEPFRRPLQPIPDRVQQAIERGARDGDAPSVADPGLLLEVSDGGDGLTDDVVRLADGRLVVACLTEMPGVTASMWDWWFSWHSYTSERYRLWHPTDHVAASLAEDRRHVESIRGRWVGNTSYVDEYIGGHLQQLAIHFVEPGSIGFDRARLDEIGVAISARTALRREPLAAGWLVHLIEDTADGCRMHSRFLLGGGDHEVPDQVGQGLLLHCSQEMNHLASLLPELHVRFGAE